MSVEVSGYLEQNKSASGIARKSWEGVETGNGGLLGALPFFSAVNSNQPRAPFTPEKIRIHRVGGVELSGP